MSTDPKPEISITWIGHATVLIDIAGVRVLTDPALTARLAHLTRRHPRPEAPAVDAVLVSHLHMDHLHVPSLRLLGGEPELVVPGGAGRLVRKIPSSSVAEVGPGDRLEVGGGVEVEVVMADHGSGRGPHSRRKAPPMGFVLRAGGRSVYFAGDTDLFEGMAELGPIDVALLPIWGWGAALGEGHLNPETAAAATELILPELVVPVHWGTFSPIRVGGGRPPWLDRPLEDFRGALGERDLADRLVALPPGGSFQVGESGRVETNVGPVESGARDEPATHHDAPPAGE